jgi:hypothetical protein
MESSVKRLSFVLFALALSCSGGDPPGTVDEESIALDVGACAKGGAGCVAKGTKPVELLAPGSESAISIPEGASISGPLQRPFDGKLSWLALGTRSSGTAKLQIQIGDAAPTIVRPAGGYSRIEIEMGNSAPAKGANITVTGVAGTVEVAWIVGRWTR